MVRRQCTAGHIFGALSPGLDTRPYLPEGNFQTEYRGAYWAAVAYIPLRNQLSNYLNSGAGGYHPRLLFRHYPVYYCGV
jgi:hypothetical protein